MTVERPTDTKMWQNGAGVKAGGGKSPLEIGAARNPVIPAEAPGSTGTGIAVQY